MFAKFLVTVAVIAVIWFGFQYLQRLAELKERRRTRRIARHSDGPPAGVQDMARCPACGTWAARPRRCGRGDCPY